MLRELHLFAGAGGGILAGKMLGHRCVGAVEVNEFCQQVLRERQQDGTLESFPIINDVCTFDGTAWRGKVDVVCGGFPCQPWSNAGKRRGASDPRHLWPQMARIINEIRPQYVFAENVSLAAFAEPWRDLRAMGYRVPPAICIGAAHVGAPHRRLRWWLLAADSNSVRKHAVAVNAEVEIAPQSTCDSHCKRLEIGQSKQSNTQQKLTPVERTDWWKSEPNVGRVAHGVPARVHRLRALGNAQVPAQAVEAWSILMRVHYQQMAEVSAQAKPLRTYRND